MGKVIDKQIKYALHICDRLEAVGGNPHGRFVKIRLIKSYIETLQNDSEGIKKQQEAELKLGEVVKGAEELLYFRVIWGF